MTDDNARLSHVDEVAINESPLLAIRAMFAQIGRCPGADLDLLPARFCFAAPGQSRVFL